MADDEDQKRYISMKKSMDGIRSPETFMEMYNKDEFGQTGKLKPYKCQKACGFSGGFYDVAKHERHCTAGQQSQAAPMLQRPPMVFSRGAPPSFTGGPSNMVNVSNNNSALSSNMLGPNMGQVYRSGPLPPQNQYLSGTAPQYLSGSNLNLSSATNLNLPPGMTQGQPGPWHPSASGPSFGGQNLGYNQQTFANPSQGAYQLEGNVSRPAQKREI